MKQREIKFRVWDKENKIMISCITVDIEWHRMATKDKDRYIRLQSTGVLDKSKKMVFEGDVVSYSKASMPYFEVVFRDGSFRAVNKRGAEFGITKFIPVEIIGNIYENPELLTKDWFDKD